METALMIRRGRRDDFAAVMRLLAPAETAAADRRTLRRFRNVVADLGADLYVAHLGGLVVGVIHASYARQLSGAQRARVEDLAADPAHDAQEIERRLLEFIAVRARRRACSSLCCVPAASDASARGAGLEPHQTEYRRVLDGGA